MSRNTNEGPYVPNNKPTIVNGNTPYNAYTIPTVAGLAVKTAISFVNPYSINNRLRNTLTTQPETDAEANTPYGSSVGYNSPSALGTPVLSWITFIGASYSSVNDNSKIITFKNLTILNCLVTVRTAKNIVKTKVPGKKGTIKTYMSADDAEITIEGVIYNTYMTQGVYPYEEMQNFMKICSDSPITVQIESPYLNNICGIDSMVIETVEIGEERGGYSQQKFYIRGLSDEQIDINLTPYNS